MAKKGGAGAALKTQAAKPGGFLSYTHFDYKHSGGWIGEFRKQLSGEIQAQTGEPFDIFFDRASISWGQNWAERIKASVKSSTFFFAILTPSFLKSTECKEELRNFLKHEKALGRTNLLLSIQLIDCEKLLKKQKKTIVAKAIEAHQRADWRELRFESLEDRIARKAIADLASDVCEAMEGAD